MKYFPVLLAVALVAGCTSGPAARRVIETAPPAPPSGFETESGRDAATIAEMRAAPAPAVPELASGKTVAGDRSHLIAQGFVPIGRAHLDGDETAARRAAIRQGQQVGADRVLLYAAGSAVDQHMQNAAPDDWLATYYVRFQLPFGATFRNLRAQERAALGSAGGVAIGAVVAGTPASRANLIAGDLVVKFDGKPFGDRTAFQALLKTCAGHPVTLTIVRSGVTLQRVVRLGLMAH